MKVQVVSNPRAQRVKNRGGQAGYTLMEIMLVVAIIAVLAGGVIIKMTGILDVTKIQRSEQDIANIYSALKLYEARNNQMPDQGQGLDALVNPPTTGTPPSNWVKLMDGLPIDPWNTPYQYRNPGKRDPSGVDVYSLGPSRKEGDGNIYRRVN
jgi:general secretion pathway protein G